MIYEIISKSLVNFYQRREYLIGNLSLTQPFQNDFGVTEEHYTLVDNLFNNMALFFSTFLKGPHKYNKCFIWYTSKIDTNSFIAILFDYLTWKYEYKKNKLY